jgi:FKBP-type peptidyl-prolyl cis-trans isomerase
MASKKTRFFMGFMAVLFLVTASATTIAVIWSSINSKGSNNSNSSQSNQPQEQKMNPNQLQGKPLADFTPTAHIDQLQTIDTTPGTGDTVKPGDTVTVDYTGAVAATGIVFQSSKDSGQPIPLALKSGSVIEGFVQGVPGMKVGGTRRILIPSSLGYGAQGNSGIPPNADLVFDVTVHKIGQ